MSGTEWDKQDFLVGAVRNPLTVLAASDIALDGAGRSPQVL